MKERRWDACGSAISWLVIRIVCGVVCYHDRLLRFMVGHAARFMRCPLRFIRPTGKELTPELLKFSPATIDSSTSTRSRISSYATLSQAWKEAVEILTFHSLEIQSGELTSFRLTVIGSHRRHLTSLAYRVRPPEHPEDKYSQPESDKEQESNNLTFTRDVVALLSILKQ
jgi:hypothetical protein